MNIFQRALKAGYSVIPCNGKIPNVRSWRRYMQKQATVSEAGYWNGNIAVICGRVSGGLVCIDFDVKNGNKWDDWILDVNNIGPELLSKLYMETTPSGGYHVCYRAESGVRNLKLANNQTGQAMIETRGEGGYFVCAPSKGYAVYYGKLSKLKKLTDGEEATLLAVCESYNKIEREKYKPQNKTRVEGDTVFNRYDSVVDPVPLLQAHGWQVAGQFRNNRVYLRRPGKRDGISASWNVIPGRFYCFSTSTDFESERAYKPSAIYAILEHNGDFRGACRELAQNAAYKPSESKVTSWGTQVPPEPLALDTHSETKEKGAMWEF